MAQHLVDQGLCVLAQHLDQLCAGLAFGDEQQSALALGQLSLARGEFEFGLGRFLQQHGDTRKTKCLDCNPGL